MHFKTIIKMIMGMGSGSLSGEILKWFDYAEDTASVSAFVQQRSKIKYNALKFIFKSMVSRCDRHLLYKGYRLLATDGSDLRLPTNKTDSFSFTLRFLSPHELKSTDEIMEKLDSHISNIFYRTYYKNAMLRLKH